MNQMNISEYKKNLRNLKANVYGHYKEIAKKAKVSVPTVSDVLNGHFVNQNVLKAAKAVEARLIKEQQELTKMIAPN